MKTPEQRARRGLVQRLLAIILLACMSPGLAAEPDALFGADLGRWLRAEAAPSLAATLGQHPRFSGETVRVVAMRDGQPSAADNALAAALRRQLTHLLLGTRGLRIAWDSADSAPCALPRDVPYLLGVELKVMGARTHSVRIALVDVEEAVWVDGINLAWRGALSPAERAAAREPVRDGPRGTLGSPLPVTAADAIARRLLAGIDCQLPAGLDEPVWLAEPDAPEQAAVAVALAGLLRHSPRLTLVGSEAEAAWTLLLERGRGDELIARITPLADNPGAAQRLASVFVDAAVGEGARIAQAPAASGYEAPAASVPRTPVRPAPPAHEALPAANGLLRALRPMPARPGDRCYGPEADCVEVEIEMQRPAYLVMFRTQPNGDLTLPNCSSSLRRIEAPKRYRLKLRGGIGVYAVATERLQVAHRLLGLLRAGATNCAGSRAPIDPEWLDYALARIAALEDDIDWRSLRFEGDRPWPEQVASRAWLGGGW
ncbi:MAG: hypothetical protein AAF515_19870 [Pseudomonadota bacterium]